MGEPAGWLERFAANGMYPDRDVWVNAPEPVLPVFKDEGEFQDAVNQLLKAGGWEYYHTHDSRRSNPGFPDVVALRDTVQLVAELKVLPNKPSADQERWLAKFAKVGALTFVWYPSDYLLIKELTK